MGAYTPGAGSSGKYTGPGSSLRKNNKVGAGQDTPGEERREKKAESKENSAIKQLQSAQKMETGAGQAGYDKKVGSGAGRKAKGKGPTGLPPGMAPPMIPGGAIPPAGRRPGKMARKVPTMFRRGK